MIIRQTCVYMVIVSGILLFTGCAVLADRPQGEAQLDSSTLGTQSKTIAGVYRDIGSDGSIKPHPQPSYNMSQEPESRTEGTITVGGPVDVSPLKEFIQTETDKASRRLRPNNTGSSGEASGRGRK
jgi:hypothetical protein